MRDIMYITDEYADVYTGLMWSCDQSLIYIHTGSGLVYGECGGVLGLMT